jgi:hypothetical protein
MVLRKDHIGRRRVQRLAVVAGIDQRTVVELHLRAEAVGDGLQQVRLLLFGVPQEKGFDPFTL